MAMRTASPWWASLIFGIGLLFILLGERLFGHLPGVRMALTTIGVLTLLGVTGLRAFTMMRSTGGRRAVERAFLLCQLPRPGCLAGAGIPANHEQPFRHAAERSSWSAAAARVCCARDVAARFASSHSAAAQRALLRGLARAPAVQ